MAYVPCYVTNDHYWHGGSCSECGKQLRCICGRFIKVDDLDTHMRNACPTIARMEREEPPPYYDPATCSTCGSDDPDKNMFCSNGFHYQAPEAEEG